MAQPLPPSDLAVQATLAAIESLGNTLALARAFVSAGREVELAGLDSEAARLCAALACLPEGAGATLQLPLHALAGEVDRLIGAIEAA
ncbi:MAG: hypothetical protein MUF65_03780 [Rubritepida sp.]|jgi:hypothetical protein|nr:hypothetical protein [Rubritepida sp.]MCU0944473.1 hypothetical protein [Rubritepida sp.]